MFSGIWIYGLVLVCVTIPPLPLAEKPEDGCGRSDLGPQSGFLSSKNYPDKYPRNLVCERKLRVPSSRRIVLTFEDISIEGVDCETDYLKVLKDDHGTPLVYWRYCGEAKSPAAATSQPLYTDASELTVSFRSSRHSSGAGFRLSYSTVNRTELLTCSDKGSHFSLPHYRKFCPSGCGAAAGDVEGDVSQGYRHTSVLCKAAVHAGIFPDRFGGAITVEEGRGLRYYESVQANGIKSKAGSLSETLFTFVTSDCPRQTVLHPAAISSSWEKDVSDVSQGERSPSVGRFVSPTGIWDESESKRWLQIDLGEKRRITGILTKGSDAGDYVESYKIMYKEKSRWRSYAPSNSSDDTIFPGNVDNLYQTRNTFRPSFAARYVRVVPLQWRRGIGLSAELLGCLYVREIPVLTVVNVTSAVTQEVLSSLPEPDQGELPEPLPQSDLVRLIVIVVAAVGCVAVLLVSGICAFKVLQKKKSKENMYDSANLPQTGCWKQVKHPSTRQQSTEFTFSYSSEKDHLPKMDLVTSDMADYQQPLMLGVGTVSRKGSTFRPMDTDQPRDTTNETASHYDYLHTANQYALPLTNQEPEYATPIVERHTFRKDAFVPDPSYSVPGAVLSKSSSFRATDNSKYRKLVGGSVSGGYQTPQTKRNRPCQSEGGEPGGSAHTEEVYDSPKGRNPAAEQNGGCAAYQSPQTQSYSSPRDCVGLRPDPEGCSLSGT